jgi:YVTN family beta-propeller protein
MLMTGCGGSSSAGPAVQPVRTPLPTASRLAHGETPPYVVSSMKVGMQPCAVEGGFGSIWVSVFGTNTELRIDPSSHQVLARIHVGQGPCGIAVGGGSVWVENFTSDNVSRIDPATNRATTIKAGVGPYDVTYDAGAAWVTNYSDGTVTRIDATTNKTARIKVGSSPNGVAPVDNHTVLVTNKGDGTVSRIDTTSLKVHTTPLGDMPAWTAWGEGVVWVSDGTTLRSVDTMRTARFRDQLNDGDIVAGKVWVTDSAGALHEVDAVTGQVIGNWPLGLTDPFVLAGYQHSLWVVDFKGTKLDEIDPTLLP